MEQNVLVTKMIGIVIAVIVAAVVLVPICNSLAESDGGSGGDSGGGTEGVVYTLNERYVQDYPDWPYKSYQVYSPVVEGSSPFSISTSYLVGILDNLRSMNVARDTSLTAFVIGCEDLMIYGTIRADGSYEQGMEYSLGFTVQGIENQEEIFYNGNIWDTSSASNAYQGKQGSFEFVGNSNGSYTLNESHYSFSDNSMVSNSYSGQVDYIALLSTSENGYYMAEFQTDCPVFDGQDYLMFIEDSNETSMSLDHFSCQADMQISGATYTLTGSHNNTTYTLTGDTIQIESGTGINVSYEDAENVEVTPPTEDYIMMVAILLSTYGTIEGDGDSGGDGGSSDLGTAGTLIKVIPIFVILGILMGAVGLFYYNRNTV